MLAIIAVLGVAVTSAPVAAQESRPTNGSVTSTFDDGADGWTLAGDPVNATPTFASTGGNPDGYVGGTDSSQGVTWFYSAPEAFLGDRSSYYGGSLSFDLRQSRTDSPFESANDVVLVGEETTLTYDTGSAANHPTQNWTEYEVPLTAGTIITGGWVNQKTGDLATESEIRSVLGSLEELRIRGEFRSGADSSNLDNVVLREGATTPPATVNFDDQLTDGTSVTVESVSLSEGGFVTIHDATLLTGNTVGSVVGISEKLPAGTHENVTVELFDVPGRNFSDGMALDDRPTNQTLVAMPHADTDDDGVYDFVASDGETDGPYTQHGSPIVDLATVTRGGDDPGDDDGMNASASSTFDTDRDGWTVANNSDSTTPEYEATGGNPGGYITDEENKGGDVWYFVAPDTFTGDRSSYYGGSLSFDQRQPRTDSQFDDTDDVVLVGEETTLTYDTGTTDAHPGQNWTDYEIPLAPTSSLGNDGWVNQETGELATPQELRTVLGNLEELRIRGEFRSGADSSDLDNVVMRQGEEPAAVTLGNQTSDGTSVTVESVTVPESGFVTVHDRGLLLGDATGSVIGVSEELSAGTHENVTVELFDAPGRNFSEDMQLTETQTLIAMPHADTDGDGVYDFVASNGKTDGPFTGPTHEPIVDPAVVTVADDGGNDTDEMPELSVQLEEDQISPGDTTTAEIVLSKASDGLAGFDINVTVGVNGDAIQIADAEYGDAFSDGLTAVPEYGDDNTSVTFRAADIQRAVESGAENVTLATVELEAVGSGSAEVNVTEIEALEDDQADTIDVARSGATLNVIDIVPIVDDRTPTDPDGDGFYEDTDGDGEFTYADVVVLFENLEGDAVQNYAYDFDGIEGVTYNDIVALFEGV